MKIITKISVLSLLLFLLMGSCENSKQIKTLRLAHTLDTNHPVHLGMEHMAEQLDEVSGGKLKIQIFPSGQLGGERELVELLQIGSLAMTKVSSAVMENFSPNFKVLSLPYLFNDDEHAFEVLDGKIGKDLLHGATDFKLYGLGFYDAGSRSFYTKERMIEVPGDLGGLKIRVMKSNTAVNMVNALGGTPTPISYGELYTALQQGVVDGAENNPPSFYTSKHYEICKYYSLDEHTTIPDVLLISTDAWNKLNEQEQKWLQIAADKSIKYQRILWAASEKESLEKVQAAGVEISRPDKKKFQEQVSSLYQAYEADTAKFKLIQDIKQMAND